MATGVLGLGRSPLVQALLGWGYLIVCPQPVRYALWARTWLAAPGSPWKWDVSSVASAGQLHGISSKSPSLPCCPVCCVCDGATMVGSTCSSKVASMAYNWAISPTQFGDSHRPPPGMHILGVDPTTFWL